ncbi:chaperone protein DnaJ [Trypanosoma grayi]|uniref:chaperone protein DnaJ n=1 Tax=Trypanosoma grayi TaxID=71804 RepID=UPI0004F4AB39|nr:chaperone protein DnaJ [Trypanosoma grayi]KEG10828.1 chaperone protein DnaJ [Trypanosoma grayi]
MVNSGIGGSDESFISFAFAIVSVVMIILYIPWLISHVRGTFEYYTSPRKKRSGLVNPLVDIWDSLTYIPRVMMLIAENPAMLLTGARVCWSEKVFFFRCVMPKFLKFTIRPKILVLWLWVVLFSSAMYVTLTFDAHAVLGIAPTATTSEIKKAYRALSKRYHPDHNKTDEARDIYISVRRAYKALVDREAFEEEEAKNVQEFSVGIALPRFLTSREHDGLVLFGLLGILIGLPVIIWYNFRGTQKIPHLLWRVRFDKERVERFLKHFGIPEDPKYVEKRDSRRSILRVLVTLGILPDNANESIVASFPPFPEFIMRCVEAEKNMSFLQNYFSPSAIETLHEYMVVNGVQLHDEFVAAHTDAAPGDSSSEPHLASQTEYKALRYLFWQHTEQVDQALEELLETMGGSLPSARKLLNLHVELFDLLRLVFEGEGKPIRQHVQKLIAMPQRVSDIVDSLEPEIETAYKRFYKNYLQQQQQSQLGNKHERRALKLSMRKL